MQKEQACFPVLSVLVDTNSLQSGHLEMSSSMLFNSPKFIIMLKLPSLEEKSFLARVGESLASVQSLVHC